ncbi:DUF3102 domain-containing protein [Candidatus Pacearchaeota archaeon]|nr:DUF3102 domain-containing protein [Candidatus Pacearchaeota archaeon]
MHPDITIAEKVNKLHQEIKDALTGTIEKAILIGNYLVETKERVGHGSFGAWIKASCSFSHSAADNYIKIAKWQEQIRTRCGNLQEAYQVIASIETKEKQAEAKAREKRIKHVVETGEKPADWTRADDYELKKKRDADAFTERMEKIESEDAELKDARTYDPRKVDALIEEAKEYVEQEKANAHLAMTGIENYTQKGIFVAIEHYVNSFDTTARKLEAAHNLIKKLKIMAAHLDALSSAEAKR